tara:strand:+ start:180 stop:1508 length:1329 start_codon:yes stop_codon:yes gene_type:complete
MHTSLDSALGRQRRLNQVGETVNSIATPVAAYSLRSLSGGDPLAVRVRRSRDNDEKDFNVSGVSGIEGYITTPETGWNTQPTWSISGSGNIVSQSSTATTSTLTVFAYGTSHTIERSSSVTHIKASSGDVITVNLTITNLAQNAALHFRNNGSSVQSTTVSNGTADYTITAPDTVTDLAFIDIETPDDFSNATITFNSVSVTAKTGYVTKWYDQSGNNRPLIQTSASEQPMIVESGSFLNGVKSNKASSNSTMQNLQVSTDGTNANFGTDDWASGASSKLGLIYIGSVPTADVVNSSNEAIIWGGGRGVSSFQSGGLNLAVIKAGNDSWRILNERQGLSPSTMKNAFTLNSDSDIVLYGIADNREFTINVNGSGDTETESADLDTRENAALSLFGAYDGNGTSYYQRSSGGVCKECYLYAGTSITSIPTIATKINEHYSIYS